MSCSLSVQASVPCKTVEMSLAQIHAAQAPNAATRRPSVAILNRIGDQVLTDPMLQA